MALDIATIKELISDHMNNQPYSITCSECGKNLTAYSIEVDGDMDLSIQVVPCDCQSKE